ncbi:MAG: ATP-binding protein [Candidatus Ratteibacteria bacterium]|nr:ATP-binding protein [Candidatus Ratteibacteria bacterium]
MIIAVASGKGGTGKTLVATGLALSLKDNVQFFDCDVEEPNASIFLKPKIEKKEIVYLPKPIVEPSHCTGCGKCAEVCQYNAIAVVKGKVLIFNELCHSCGACSLACPEKAIFEVDSEKGVLEGGRSNDIEFWQGSLKVGEAAPTPLIKALKKKVDNKKTVIIDSSPGTSCPMVEAVKDADFVILVTEPTPFGLNDLTLAIEVVRQLKIPFGVIINRCDKGDEKVELYCQENKIPILIRIPFDRKIAELYSKGIPFVTEKKEYLVKFREMFKLINKELS